MLFTFHVDMTQIRLSIERPIGLWPTSPSYKTVIKDKAEDEQIHVKAATAENG